MNGALFPTEDIFFTIAAGSPSHDVVGHVQLLPALPDGGVAQPAARLPRSGARPLGRRADHALREAEPQGCLADALHPHQLTLVHLLLRLSGVEHYAAGGTTIRIVGFPIKT